MKKNEKGFTLIELLAVIVILGLLIAIAIPSITKYITQSKRKTLVTSINGYVSAIVNEVNDQNYYFSTPNVIFAVPIECISLEKGGTNPFGDWLQANNNYWAYVLVQYDANNFTYKYGFTFKDSSGYGMYPTEVGNINPTSSSQIVTGLNLEKPVSGLYSNIAEKDKWNGFDIQDDTELIVLEAESEGKTGNGKTTCTLCQKGSNYGQTENGNDDSPEGEEEDTKPGNIVSGSIDIIGSEICISDECFYVIEYNTTTITMLAKHKIDLTTYKQNASASGSAFAIDDNYWSSAKEWNKGRGTILAQYGTSYPAFVYDANSSMYNHVESYELYIQSLGATSASASLISTDQLVNLGCSITSYTCKSSPYSSWLIPGYRWYTGSAGANFVIWFMMESGLLSGHGYEDEYGVRPIITISTSEVNIS